LAAFSFLNTFLNFDCKLNVLKIRYISIDNEQVVNKIVNTFISLSLTAFFRCLHTFHHSKIDKCEILVYGSLGDTDTDQSVQCWTQLNHNEMNLQLKF